MLLELNNITKSYQRGKRKFPVIAETSISIETGELLVLSGKSGSGKSTLLALMGGYLKPNAGKIRLNDEMITEMDDDELAIIHSEKIAYLPQSNVMLSEFTVMENICLQSFISGREYNKDKLTELIELLEISPLIDMYPPELSGGELRRVALARMFLNEVELYLIDEPSNGLDEVMVKKVMQYIQKYIQNGSTVVIATHDQMVKQYGNRNITFS